MPLAFIMIAAQLFLAMHAMRTGRNGRWLYIILFLPGIGIAAYVLVELAPEFWNGQGGALIRRDVQHAINPDKEYNLLTREVAIAPTVHNKLKLAEECLQTRRYDEAIALCQSCLEGIHQNDSAVLMLQAKAYFGLNDFENAIATLDTLRHHNPDFHSQDGHLIYAQSLDKTGQSQKALDEYAALISYYRGEEARCHYAILLQKTGAIQEAKEQLEEILRRISLAPAHYRREQHIWQETAKRILGK